MLQKKPLPGPFATARSGAVPLQVTRLLPARRAALAGLAALLPLACLAPSALQAAEAPEPRIQVRVAEDDKVRIEEVRVRGEVRRVVVRQKAASAPDYEIVPYSGAQDPSLRRGQSSGSGERVWRLFSF